MPCTTHKASSFFMVRNTDKVRHNQNRVQFFCKLLVRAWVIEPVCVQRTGRQRTSILDFRFTDFVFHIKIHFV